MLLLLLQSKSSFCSEEEKASPSKQHRRGEVQPKIESKMRGKKVDTRNPRPGNVPRPTDGSKTTFFKFVWRQETMILTKIINSFCYFCQKMKLL